MNKTAIWAIGGVIAIALAAFLLVSMKSSSPAGVGASQTQSETSSGSIAALVAKGGTVQCQVNHSSEKESTSGTVYVASGKVRGDFQSAAGAAGNIESHMISDGEFVYVWSSAMPSGMKMKATKPNENPNGPTSGKADPYNQSYDYNCSPWGGDASKFQLPSGVTFNDMSAMMQSVGAGAGASATGGAKVPAPNCSMCDQAPEASRAQCRAALGCK